MSTLFSAVIKPNKPLLYICDESTLITNIALCPISYDPKASKSLTTLPPFLTILKLQYEGPVIEGENDEDDEQVKSGKKSVEERKGSKTARKDEDSDSEDSDYEGLDIEAKEVVIGCFTPNTLQITTDLFLAPNDQYRFILSGGADHEVHLLGRYITNSGDESPDDYDSDESDDYMDDFDLDQITDEGDESVGDRIREVHSDDEEIIDPKSKANLKPNKTIVSAASKGNRDSKETSDVKKSKKRALDDKADTSADISMADSAIGNTDDKTKLSKSQRKKLKKNQTTNDSPAPSATNNSPKKDKIETSKPTSDTKATAASTISLPSGLKITDTKIGQGVEAKPGQQVAMRYIGKLTNGKVFDSNTKGKPFSFKLGRGEVIKGWDEGIKGMKLGGERKLIVPAQLAYGKNGAPPDIPPNSTLAFDVKLLAIK